MDDNKNNRNYSDELYTITLHEQPEKSEIIPERIPAPERIPTPEHIPTPERIPLTAENHTSIFISKSQKKSDYYDKHKKPAVLTTSSIIARQEYFKPPIINNLLSRKSFIELAHEYVDKTYEKTEHIPFMCYWPSYEYMSNEQLNWYFYMRSRIRLGEYIETDLSYLFVYIYELINQVGISSPDVGFIKIINVWINYRNIHSKLDRYLTDWTGDYLSFYEIDADIGLELLKKEGLFLLMPTDMLTDYYFKNGLVMPIELIARFTDYKFYESEFIKGENGNLFTDYISDVIHNIRCHMNKKKEGSFEQRDIIESSTRRHKKLPFQKSTFSNPDHIRIDTYLPYEQHKPFRFFITTVIKEFENQLRILTKYKGRLRPEKLPDDILNICKTYAKNAFDGMQPEQKIEISIDREKLLALIHDSDEVRKKLIEGNYEYEDEFKPAVADDSIKPLILGTQNDIIPAEYVQLKQVQIEQVQIKQERFEYSQMGHDKIEHTQIGQESNSFKTNLMPIQQKILDYLLLKDGNSTMAEMSLAFQGVFIGVEIDKINDAALNEIGDLLIGFEDNRWYIMEDYINYIT